MKKDSLLKKNKIPASLQAILWSKDIENIDSCDDNIYIIHQTLAYGDMDEIKWLFTVYLKDEIKNIFISHPSKIYTRPIYFFIKDFRRSSKLFPLKYVFFSIYSPLSKIKGLYDLLYQKVET